LRIVVVPLVISTFDIGLKAKLHILSIQKRPETL
jgi:hypothetical protein